MSFRGKDFEYQAGYFPFVRRTICISFKFRNETVKKMKDFGKLFPQGHWIKFNNEIKKKIQTQFKMGNSADFVFKLKHSLK